MPSFIGSPVSSEAAALIEDTVHYITSLLPITPETPLPDFTHHYPLFDATHRELGAMLSGPWKESTSTIDSALVGEAGNVWNDGLGRTSAGGESLRRSAEEASHASIHIANTIITGALDISGIANRYLTTATSLLTGSMSIPILMGPIPLQPGTGILPALKEASAEARHEADKAADRINSELERDGATLQRLLEKPSPAFPQCEVNIPPDSPQKSDTAPAVASPASIAANDVTASPGAAASSLGDHVTVAQPPSPSAAPPPPSHAAASGASPQAQQAVEAARSAIGTPYQWGGNTPGVGLDCSGLTHWAYAQAGVDIPRLAEAQTVGTPVTHDQLLPGDLVVWDRHVAMYAGDGMMIEAGDPVQTSPLRTTNMGMNFLGFYRPTG
ncbi:C40 family peptidase [Corynebacterium kroppenstedtii]|uniref:C40 family peptidase n=1 Tax=Corynebacterium kroppenstedtii TaxID=161879 RepID=UPI00264FB281|nr:C40 family peptidase [Corynebacterium kroppenstedtii]MDN8624015.1 NlpC/P60 family protein [Corynebacterium kroppenstedtii]